MFPGWSLGSRRRKSFLAEIINDRRWRTGTMADPGFCFFVLLRRVATRRFDLYLFRFFVSIAFLSK